MTKQDDNFKICMKELDKISKKLDDMKEKILTVDVLVWVPPFFAAIYFMIAFITWVAS